MSRYLSDLVKLRCASRLLSFGIFPNAKEVTESFGAWDAIRRHLPYAPNRRDVLAVCVGDGVSPRTGATIALRSGWRVLSVDPLMRAKWAAPRIERLSCSRAKIEDLRISHLGPVVIVAVHSHARLEDARRVIEAPEVAAVAIPCCVPQVLPMAPDAVYWDEEILSPAREVRVWRVA
jgi:hypothetical protein